MAEQSADLMREWVRLYLPMIVRILRGAQYAGLAVAGGWLLTAPTTLLQTALGTSIAVWSGFMVLGGILCFLGTVTKIWVGEFTGLVLLIFGNVIWGWALLSASTGPSNAYGIVLLSWAAGLGAREAGILEKNLRAVKAQKRRRERGPADG